MLQTVNWHPCKCKSSLKLHMLLHNNTSYIYQNLQMWWMSLPVHTGKKHWNVQMSVITYARWIITPRKICWYIRINHRLKYWNVLNMNIRTSGNVALNPWWYIMIHYRLKSSNVIDVINCITEARGKVTSIGICRDISRQNVSLMSIAH